MWIDKNPYICWLLLTNLLYYVQQQVNAASRKLNA